MGLQWPFCAWGETCAEFGDAGPNPAYNLRWRFPSKTPRLDVRFRCMDEGSGIWEGTAADLANRHGIAVYPTGGWWREKRSLERYDREVRYALLLTLRAQTAVDLYTEIENAIAVEVEIGSG